MFAVSLLAAHLRRASSLCRAFVLISLLAATSQAQSDAGIDSDPGDPGTGGRNTIQGRVYFPSGRQMNKRLRVRLASVRGPELSVMTDDNGAFTFRRLAGGSYRLTVEAGKEYETATETVDIFDPAFRSRRDRAGQTITVQIQLQLKRGDAAVTGKPAVVNASLAGIPKPARELYEKALLAAQAGDHKKAIEQLRDALALHPDFALAFNELGVQYLKLGQSDKAAEAFRSALKIAPDLLILHLNYGIVLLQQKRYGEAEAELRLALERDEASATAHLYRGRALIGLRRYDEAEKELQRAISLGGDEVSMAHRYLGAIYIEQGKTEQAVSELETYLRLAPKAKEAEQIREIIKQLRAQATTRKQ